MRSLLKLMPALAALALVCWQPPARAEHFDMFLALTSESGVEARAGWDTFPPIGGVNERSVLQVQVGEAITAEWLMRSAYPHGVMPQVQVHFYVVREQMVGQKQPPLKSVPRVVESSFKMDFIPDFATKGVLVFVVDKPGVYLARMESLETLGKHGHEHFSAIDLVVE